MNVDRRDLEDANGEDVAGDGCDNGWWFGECKTEVNEMLVWDGRRLKKKTKRS